ncbi:MAG: YkgJ family cysteine cluster protein [Candidatus Helarchaeota archaeon]
MTKAVPSHPDVFTCQRCGNCCRHPNTKDASQRYIPIYLDEIEALQDIARERDVALDLKEDVMYPDYLNKRLIIISYALKFSDCCPFYDKNMKGCTIYENRPLTCRAYPVSIWREDGFRTLMHLEMECKHVQANSENLHSKSFEFLETYFQPEFKNAKQLMIKGKNILYDIIQLEKAEIIDVGFLNQKIDFFFEIENAKTEFLTWPRVKISELRIDD